MGNIISKYNEDIKTGQFETKNEVRILQIYGESGILKIGEDNYPIYDGFLYFIGENTKYSINTENAKLSEIIIYNNYLEKISTLLDFKKEYEKIFYSKNGVFIKIINNKTVDNKFKVVNNLIKSERLFYNPLAVTKIIEIFNYAV